jgi:hypothetical protein
MWPGLVCSRAGPNSPNHFNLKGKTMDKGKDYDRELKQAGVKLDRKKPDTTPRELDVEALDGIDKAVGRNAHRRVTGH